MSTKSDILFGPLRLENDAETLALYADHLRHLDPESLRLRFGFTQSNESAAQWAESIDFNDKNMTHVLWGTKNGWNDLVGVCHLVIDNGLAEIALSTSGAYRRRGISQALFEVAISYLQNRGIEQLYVVCLSENTPVQKLARKCGLAVVTLDGESVARLTLPWATPSSVARETIANTLTLMDRQMKMRSAVWDRFLTRPKYQAIINQQEPENGKD